MSFKAELIAVGTELLLGNVANTDAQFISEQLAAIGVDVLYHTTVGDNATRLREVIEIARKRADLLIFTGGMGPTYDDFTKVTVCETLGVKLIRRPELVDEIRTYFETVLHKEMTPSNLQQADQPEGAYIIHNPVGTAPCCIFEKDGLTVVMLPGVPYECRYLTEHEVIPWLKARSGSVIVSHDLRCFGIGESALQDLIGDLMDQAVNPSLAPYAKAGECMLRLTAKGKDEAACEELMAPLFWDVKARLGDKLYGVDVPSLEARVLELLKNRGMTFAAAESCTGGLIAKRITDLAGASSVFKGGIVSYTNEVKATVLGVPQKLLDTYGAVSAPVAQSMAENVRRLTGADLGVSVTGVAGPDKDDRGNEVGTVFVALADSEHTVIRQLSLGAGRSRIRTLSANHVFDLLRRYLTDLPLE